MALHTMRPLELVTIVEPGHYQITLQHGRVGTFIQGGEIDNLTATPTELQIDVPRHFIATDEAAALIIDRTGD